MQACFFPLGIFNAKKNYGHLVPVVTGALEIVLQCSINNNELMSVDVITVFTVYARIWSPRW